MMEHALLLLILTVPALLGWKSGGVFTSSADLVNLVTTEAELVDKLENLLQDEHNRLIRLEEVVGDYKSFRDSTAAQSSEEFVGNPINSFKLIKKLTSEWEMLQGLIRGNAETFLVRILTERDMNVLKWPSEEDLSGAAIGLLRLQDTYKLNASSLAKGIVNGNFYGTKLSAQDCFELGRQSFNTGDFFHAIVWLEEGLEQLKNETAGAGADISPGKAVYLDYLSYAYYATGNLQRALDLTLELKNLEPNHPRASNVKIYEEAIMQNRAQGVKEEDNMKSIKEELEQRDWMGSEGRSFYESLCRGEDEVSDKEKSKMFCRYSSGHHPFLLIGPIKEEEVYLNPRIVVFHDLISECEINTIKEMTLPRFLRSQVINPETGEKETTHYRIAQSAWLKEEEHPDISAIYRRAGQVTGLNMQTSEQLQVANYGIGGHYEPHLDFAREGDEEVHMNRGLGMGNRIGTLLMYLSDVEQGGATVFTKLGISVRPKKGLVVFWWNLKPDGKGDYRTLHAGCPVLTGSKWVSNFWVHEKGQEFTRPCPRNQPPE